MKKEQKVITEEMHLEEEWYKRAKSMNMSGLMPFVREMVNDYWHDYSTAVHAVAASAVAAAWATCRKIGLSGFQASIVMWFFIKHWYKTSNETGLKLIDYDDMLYPQYEYRFEKTISPGNWESVQKKAQKLLDDDKGLAGLLVKEHWQDIVDGKVPFGYVVKDDE